MEKYFIAAVATLMLASCGASRKASTVVSVEKEKIAVFSSTDSVLERSYNWAKGMALSYSHDEGDPVGAWCEAALPNREAFCMRDVSHQTTGAHIIGLAKHNKNMMRKFAENISESRDWCTYWEINRYDKPAPVDYASDSEFWYCLNANGDVMMACMKMYDWTGDEDYISDPAMRNFYDRSVDEFISRWKLQPDSIMDREQYMNKPAGFDAGYSFHTCRGLASYVENFGGLTAAVDLVGGLYAGHEAYARIAALNGDKKASAIAHATALSYNELIENAWWDAANNRYNCFWTADRQFARGEGVPFLLWFDAIHDGDRIRAGVADILSKPDWNIENQSYFPALLYRLGYDADAYRFLTSLPLADRADYPEVSFGVVEGVVAGAMGLKPSASTGSIATLSHLGETAAEISNVPVMGGYVTLRHDGNTSTTLSNNTGRKLTWNVSFAGNHPEITAEGKSYRTTTTRDVYGNEISTAAVNIAHGKSITAKIK